MHCRVPLRKKLSYYARSHTRTFTRSKPGRFTPNAHARMVCFHWYAVNCKDFHAFIIASLGARFVLQRILSVIGFSASTPSAVGLRLSFSLFVIVPVLSLTCPAGCSQVCLRQLKMVYSDYVKQRILFYHRLGKSFVQITRCLAAEGHVTPKTNRRVVPPYPDILS